MSRHPYPWYPVYVRMPYTPVTRHDMLAYASGLASQPYNAGGFPAFGLKSFRIRRVKLRRTK